MEENEAKIEMLKTAAIDIEALRCHAEEIAEAVRVERRASTANFWKVICGLCTVIGILSGFLISDLRFMGIVTETKVRVDSLVVQVEVNKVDISKKLDEIRTQAQINYQTNHDLIQKIYDLRMK
jgi:hypothetical protein